MRIRWLIPLFFLLPLQGCYLLEQGMGQFEIWRNQIPIEEAIASETDDQIRSLLMEIPKVKEFAIHHIHLKSSDNYTGYYATDQEGIAFVVTACPRDKLEPYLWWFPIIGSVPYKGYFDKQDAEALETKLRDKGYDTWVFAAPAYSTLGWFDDPVTTPMLNSGRFSLADTIIHEMTHHRVFVDNHVDFNEQLASFVGEQGAFDYFETSGALSHATLEQIKLRKRNAAWINQMVQESIVDLENIYSSNLSEKDKTDQRQAIFDQITNNVLARFPTADRDDWIFNNARILQYRRYEPDNPEIARLWDESGADWKRFWSLVDTYISQTYE